MKEQVNHPAHYNQHPNGIECIDIIRHYTCDIANALKYLWRAGLKPEMGKDDADKEIEDLKKAIFYIEDYQRNGVLTKMARLLTVPSPTKVLRHKKDGITSAMDGMVEHVTGHKPTDITKGYCDEVAAAMAHLLRVGLTVDGEVLVDVRWQEFVAAAVRCIQQRILDIEWQLTNGEMQKTLDVLHGYAVEGEDYAKPGGKRETEPEKYDPLNIIIIQGTAYCLSDEVRKKKNGALYGPCDNCALSEYCVSNERLRVGDGTSGIGTESLKNLCNLHYATDQQYYREVGTAKYAPSFGTIEVVDEHKEMQLEMKRLEEEE